MVTGIKVTDRIHSILNITPVTALLDGAIYKEEPLNELLYERKNISLFPLTTQVDFLKQHTVNINVFCPDLASGQSDEDSLNAISEEVVAALNSYRSTTDYFAIEVTNCGLIKDDGGRSYMNIRIEVITE